MPPTEPTCELAGPVHLPFTFNLRFVHYGRIRCRGVQSRQPKVGSVKLNSIGKALGTTLSATAIAALTLTACGSDNNAGTASSSASGTGTASAKADCGGKNSLTAEGSTAQQNAIAEVNKVWG